MILTYLNDFLLRDIIFWKYNDNTEFSVTLWQPNIGRIVSIEMFHLLYCSLVLLLLL